MVAFEEIGKACSCCAIAIANGVEGGRCFRCEGRGTVAAR